MGRFSLTFRPLLFRRASNKNSVAATSTASDDTESTAASSTVPSPHPSGRQPRKSTSLAQLSGADSPDLCRQPLCCDKDQQQQQQQQQQHQHTPKKLKRTTTTPLVVEGRAVGLRSSKRNKKELGRSSPAPQHCTTTGNNSVKLETSSPSDTPATPSPPLKLHVDLLPQNPRVEVEEPTPEDSGSGAPARLSTDISGEGTLVPSDEESVAEIDCNPITEPSSSASNHPTTNLPPEASPRCEDSVALANGRVVKTLVEAEHPPISPSTRALSNPEARDYFTPSLPDMANILQRKIWVKRPNASATLVQIKEDDLVDDVRDMILRKYANSLGKTFDSPDMILRVVARSEHMGPRSERILGPEEEICRALDSYYPGGQKVDEALIIDVPPKRTPRPSPRHYQQHTSYHAMEDLRPQENGTDYFPPMPAIIQPTLPHAAMAPGVRDHHPLAALEHPRSISVLATGQVPPLPSPGGRRHRAEREHRPKYGRQHTSSPNILSHNSTSGVSGAVASAIAPAHPQHRGSNRPRVDSSSSEAHVNSVPPAPPLPSPPAPEAVVAMARTNSTPPTPSGGAPPAHAAKPWRPKKTRKFTPDKAVSRTRGTPLADPYGSNPALPNVSIMLDASVPPINVLIVEDNIINLRVLEGLMKRLKVRWQTAMNGQIAVDKWKTGGYHLVLMDIQMPIMNGLQATKEIRRLEWVNGIGVFSSSSPGSSNEGEKTNGDAGQEKKAHDPEGDKLRKAEGLFKSPVIIVALTASSLQSDRHEALAAGCNDFLTKPVDFVWLERKVKEWGCMQALIDFDGWRKWKDYAAKEEVKKGEEQKKKDAEAEEKQRKKEKKSKRESTEMAKVVEEPAETAPANG